MAVSHPSAYGFFKSLRQLAHLFHMAGKTTYTKAKAAKICLMLSEGLTLRKICKIEGMPALSTVMRWLGDDKNEAFREQYAQARESQREHWADEIIDIADDGSNDTYIDEKGNTKTDWDVVHRSRLRVDSRKWLLSKLEPKKYGDKVEAEEPLNPGETKIIFRRGPTRPSKLADSEKDESSGTEG